MALPASSPVCQAIAYAVEDQLSEALERLHLSVGARDREGRYPVMVIDRERFIAVLALLAESGMCGALGLRRCRCVASRSGGRWSGGSAGG